MWRIRDVYPGSWFLPIPDPGSRIPDTKTATIERGEKKIWCHTFLCSHKFHKIVHYFSFEVLKKKIWANFQRIRELFAQKIVTNLSKVWVWDPRSGIWKKPIPDPEKTYPGSRIQGSKRPRIRIRNTEILWSGFGARIRALFDPGSGILDEKFGSGIRYKHPGSATLGRMAYNVSHTSHCRIWRSPAVGLSYPYIGISLETPQLIPKVYMLHNCTLCTVLFF